MVNEQNEIEMLRREVFELRQELADTRHYAAELCRVLAQSVKDTLEHNNLAIFNAQQTFLIAVGEKCDMILKLDENGHRATMN